MDGMRSGDLRKRGRDRVWLVLPNLRFVLLVLAIAALLAATSPLTPEVPTAYASDVSPRPLVDGTPPQDVGDVPTGQLWYTIQDIPGPGAGCPGCNPRRVGGFFNSDGSSVTLAGPFLGANVAPHTAFSIGVDTAAGYFFIANSDHLSISSYKISNNTLVSTVIIANDFNTPSGFDDEIVQTVAVDPINHIVFAGRWGDTLAHTGIVKVSYNPTTESSTRPPPSMLRRNSSSTTTPTTPTASASTSTFRRRSSTTRTGTTATTCLRSRQPTPSG